MDQWFPFINRIDCLENMHILPWKLAMGGDREIAEIKIEQFLIWLHLCGDEHPNDILKSCPDGWAMGYLLEVF